MPSKKIISLLNSEWFVTAPDVTYKNCVSQTASNSNPRPAGISLPLKPLEKAFQVFLDF
jgi:hypothetical protein